MTSNLIKERWSPYSLNATMSMKKLKDNTRASKIIHSHTTTKQTKHNPTQPTLTPSQTILINQHPNYKTTSKLRRCPSVVGGRPAKPVARLGRAGSNPARRALILLWILRAASWVLKCFCSGCGLRSYMLPPTLLYTQKRKVRKIYNTL